MKYKLLKDLYDCFYTLPELQAKKQKIAECHQALSDVLGKPERRLVHQIIDAKDRIAEDTSIGSFIAGFELARKLSIELNHYENERSISCQTAMGLGGSFCICEGGREMKKFVIATMIAACVALCAVVWPHSNAVEETPVPAAETAVSAPKATVEETETEENSASLAETENEVPQQEVSQEERPEPETGSIEIPTAPEHQPPTGRIPTKNSAAEQTPPQAPKELHPGDKVYVAGFGWVEYEGPNHCEDGMDIYENGNKIGIMG